MRSVPSTHLRTAIAAATALLALVLATGSAGPASGAGEGVDDSPPLLVFDGNPRARTYGHLFALDPRTGRRVQLTFGPTNEPRSLARWSPDGERLVYVSESVGAASPTDASPSFDLMLMDADGTHHRRLFRTESRYVWGVAWSPDSRQVVVAVQSQGTEPARLLFVDTATGRQSSSTLDIPQRFAGALSWSKGGVIALEATANEEADDALGELYTVRPDGTDLTVLARPQYAEQGLSDPRWSPDGRRLVITRDRPPFGNALDIQVLAPDGRLLRRVPTRDDARSVSWAPDGQHLVFIAGDDDLYTVALDGSGEHLLARGVYEPDWRPGTRYELPASGG